VNASLPPEFVFSPLSLAERRELKLTQTEYEFYKKSFAEHFAAPAANCTMLTVNPVANKF
jgi:hypothetical protein